MYCAAKIVQLSAIFATTAHTLPKNSFHQQNNYVYNVFIAFFIYLPRFSVLENFSRQIAVQVGWCKYLNCRVGLVCLLRIQTLCLHREIKILSDSLLSREISSLNLKENFSWKILARLVRAEWGQFPSIFSVGSGTA